MPRNDNGNCNQCPDKKTPCNGGNNQMQSDNGQKADWKITANVKKQLMADSTLSSSARMISITTNNGVVTLTGTVADRNERNKVISIVQNVDGVQSVDDQLSISNNY
jgi:osmotically-inducible protein OsmY